jgi:hypothetical protein
MSNNKCVSFVICRQKSEDQFDRRCYLICFE